FWASVTSLLGSFSRTSFWSPTTKARGLLTPHLLTRRTSYRPSGVLAAMVTLNLVTAGLGGVALGFLASGGGAGGTMGSALLPGWLKIMSWGSSRSVPAKPPWTVEPTLPPGGVTTVRRGRGSRLGSSGCWAGAGPPASSRARAAQQKAQTAANG